MAATSDIDIDFPDPEAALKCVAHIRATHLNNGKVARHPSGAYFQNIAIDPLTGWAGMHADEAAERGYFKIDFLSNSIYKGVRDEAHLLALMRDPPWELLDFPEWVNRLAHLRDNFVVVESIHPRSIEDLAVVLALIRNGKRHLVGEDRAAIDAEIWKPTATGYFFKRSHAIAYAMSLVVQLNLLVEQELS